MLSSSGQIQHWIDIIEPQAAGFSLWWYPVALLLTVLAILILFFFLRRVPAIWVLYARYKLRKLTSQVELRQYIVWLDRILRKQAIGNELKRQLQQLRYSSSEVNQTMLAEFLQRVQKGRRQ